MKSTNKWLQRIFRWEVVGIVIAAVSLIYAYKSFKIDEGGELQVTANYSTPDNTGTIAIVTDDDNLASTLNRLLPEFRNSIKYSLKNFNLVYDITTSDAVNFTFSPDFTTRQLSPTQISLTLADHTLYAHSRVEEPFISAIPSRKSFDMTVNIRATFDGAAEPYHATCHYRFYPTSALTRLRDSSSSYAYLLEASNNRLRELSLPSTPSSPETVSTSTHKTETTSTPPQTATYNTDTQATTSKTTNIEVSKKEKSYPWLWHVFDFIAKYKWFAIAIGCLAFLILTLSDSSIQEAIWDDVHTWPWKPSEVRRKVRVTLYGRRKYTTWQKVKADLLITQSLISDIIMIIILGAAIYWIIYWIIAGCKWLLGLF